ncbi:hypothetical protein [Paenibacillus sp. EPM92]|uniref:hypothetical protein n=1 Tax=Paenibacillus sp. EPM92 TaxID=1561195 RepID=UPI00191672E2|nr:hypothetical protein [Paenibacillus sp. EPM92]
MRKFFSKAVVGVMYSSKTWSLYKTGVWMMKSMMLFAGVLIVYAGVLLGMLFSGMQLPEQFYSPSLFASITVSVVTFTFYRSLSFRPEQKVWQTYLLRK